MCQRLLVPQLRAAGIVVEPFPNVWKGTKNGRLLALIKEAGFDCLVTCDKNMHHQQDIQASGMASPTQQLEALRHDLESVSDAIKRARVGSVTFVRLRAEPE